MAAWLMIVERTTKVTTVMPAKTPIAPSMPTA